MAETTYVSRRLINKSYRGGICKDLLSYCKGQETCKSVLRTTAQQEQGIGDRIALQI